MNSDNLQRLKEDIEPKLLEILNHSTFMEMLQNYDIATEALTVEIKLNTTQLQPGDSSQEQENQQVLPAETSLFSAVRVCPCNPLVDPVDKCCWKKIP